MNIIYNVVQESSEFQLPDEENNQPQGNLVNSTSNANLSGHGHFSQESTNQQLVGSAPNNLSPIITSSLKTPLSGTAAQSSFPTVVRNYSCVNFNLIWKQIVYHHYKVVHRFPDSICLAVYAQFFPLARYLIYEFISIPDYMHNKKIL